MSEIRPVAPPSRLRTFGKNALESVMILDMDETTSALMQSIDHPLVSTLGVLDGAKGLYRAVQMMRDEREDIQTDKRGGMAHAAFALGQIFPAAMRLMTSVGSVTPGMIGNVFVGAAGVYQMVEGTVRKDRYTQVQGALQVGVAVSLGCAVMGVGGNLGYWAILGIGVARQVHHFSQRHKQKGFVFSREPQLLTKLQSQPPVGKPVVARPAADVSTS